MDFGPIQIPVRVSKQYVKTMANIHPVSRRTVTGYVGPYLHIREAMILSEVATLRGCIQKFPDGVDNEINNNKHSLRSNTEGYGDKTH